MTEDEDYWNGRALSETRAGLRCNDPYIAALHVALATGCVRKIVEVRNRNTEARSQDASEAKAR